MHHRSLSAIAALLCTVGALSLAHAADPKQDAGAHFDRGVALSSEADYPAALIEFRRAYELAPNPLVLYNIGQTYFQLRNYGAALTYFERYLAEAGAGPVHQAEAQQSIATLQTRVGKVNVESNVVGVVSIDDEPQGKTPQTGLRVSVGRHRIAVRPEKGTPQERTFEVSAGDTVPLTFSFESTSTPSGQALPPPSGEPPHRGLRPAATVSWVVAGTLAAGAIVTGVLGATKSSSLSDERANPAATRDGLDSLHGQMRAFSITTDALLVGAAVAGGVALYFTLSKPNAQTQAALGFAPQGLQLRLSY